MPTAISGLTGVSQVQPGSIVAASIAAGTVSPDKFSPTVLSNALTANVALNNTALFFDGPSLSLGTGTWLVISKVTALDSAAVASFVSKLWDGTTVIDSILAFNPATGLTQQITLFGFITNPTGPVRISVRDATTVSGSLLYSNSGGSKDCSIIAIRIG